MEKKFYRINQFIRAGRLRVIGQDGKQIGILSLNEALEKAHEQEQDLVEIVPSANPPVAKIVNFRKFLYQEEKRERAARKKIRGGETKEVRVTPFIAQADFNVRIRRAEEFLKEGNKVKISVRFKGRQMGKKEFGYEVLKKVTTALGSFSQEEGVPKWLGRNLVLTLSPAKGSKDEQKNENKKINRPTV